MDPMAEQRQVPLPGLEDLAADAPTEPAPVGGPGRQARSPRPDVRQLAVLPPLAVAGAQLHRRLARASSPSPRWRRSVADESSPEAAIGLVMSARIVPGFFLGATSGVIADRFDRKKLMVGCNIGRAVVLVCLPFVDTVVRPGVRLAAAGVLHAAVDAGQGGVGPEPGAARPPHHRQLAVPRRGLRHHAARRRHLLGAGIGVEGARRHRRAWTTSRPTRWPSRST